MSTAEREPSPADRRTESRKRLMAELERLAPRILEHADSVQIFTTLRSPDGTTTMVVFGAGDFYARLGSTREWLTQEDERARQGMRDGDDD